VLLNYVNVNYLQSYVYTGKFCDIEQNELDFETIGCVLPCKKLQFRAMYTNF